MNTTVQSSVIRVLGIAFCWSFLTPPLLVLSLATFLNSAPDHSRRLALFFIFCASAAAQTLALFKLNRCSTWAFGFPKFTSYLLKTAAFMLLLIFSTWAFITGYYLIHPNAPPIFGCCLAAPELNVIGCAGLLSKPRQQQTATVVWIGPY